MPVGRILFSTESNPHYSTEPDLMQMLTGLCADFAIIKLSQAKFLTHRLAQKGQRVMVQHNEELAVV